jgi:glucosamine--fructose-6-phosphate aminotransferase (isomerizing)
VALAAPSLITRYGARSELDGWLAVGVSQSGRTPEIVTVLQALRSAGARTVAITNDGEAPLAQAADATIATAAGDERAVPATKTVTAQIAAFAVLAEALAADGAVPWDESAWRALPEAVAQIVADAGPPRAAANAIGDAEGLVALARGMLLAAALEAALKLKETTGILAEGASTADFRHGPIAIVRSAFPALTFSAAGPTAQDVRDLAGDVRARGGRVLSVSDAPDADVALPGHLPEGLSVIGAIVRAQQIARELALLRGVDPDEPFGLSKVTATQ